MLAQSKTKKAESAGQKRSRCFRGKCRVVDSLQVRSLRAHCFAHELAHSSAQISPCKLSRVLTLFVPHVLVVPVLNPDAAKAGGDAKPLTGKAKREARVRE